MRGMNDACRNLWAAVLQAAFDIAMGSEGEGKQKKELTAKQAIYKKSRAASEKVKRERSRRFIAQRLGSFDWICSVLDLDPVTVSKKMTAAIDNNEKGGM